MFSRRSGARFNRGRAAPGGGAAAVFDPAALALTGWWRADYASSPWVGTASAGASGGRTLTEATNPPSAGAAQGGRVPADFDGTNDVISSALAADNFFTIAATLCSAMEAAVLFLADTSAPAQPDGYNDRPLMCAHAAAPGTPFGLVHTNSGIRAFGYDGTAWRKTASIACATGAYHWAFMWLSAGTVSCQLDSGVPQTVTLTGGSFVTDVAPAVRLGGPNFGGLFLDGRIIDVMTNSASGTISANTAGLIAYGNARYGLSLT